MSLKEFIASLESSAPPEMNEYLIALWYDAKGQWDKAHGLIDPTPGPEAARIHAYLHRKEGDIWNADYWYERAGSTRPADSLDEEWKFLVSLHLIP